MSTPEGTGADARVTRNNPPKLFRVADESVVGWNDKVYAGEAHQLPEGTESAGNEVLLPGGIAEQFEADGYGVILEWDATEAFNKEDNGMMYEHADKHEQFSDVTSHRQHLGQQHLALGREMTEEEA